MNIAHVSMTPVAGAAWAWAEAFREAGHESFACSGQEARGNLRFPTHEQYPPNDEAIERINAADVIFCHQGHPYRQHWYPKGKPTVLVYHSQPSHVWRVPEKDGWPWCVVGQYQPRLYPGCVPVPNLVPLEHPCYQPREKPQNPSIIFTPSSTNLEGWDAKGYADTVHAGNYAIEHGGRSSFEVVTGIPLLECLAAKARAHVCIDECVTGSYHRSSLEALAFGCVVVNHADAECIRLAEELAGDPLPFRLVALEHLTTELEVLLKMGAPRLAEMGRVCRRWMETFWNPTRLIEKHFMPLIDEAMA